MRIEFCVRNDGVGTCEQVSPSAGDYTRAIRCAQGGDGVGVVSEYGRAPPLFFRNLGRCRKSLQCNGKRPVKPRLVSSGLRLSGALYSESSRWRKPSRSRTARDSVCTELGFRLHGAGPTLFGGGVLCRTTGPRAQEGIHPGSCRVRTKNARPKPLLPCLRQRGVCGEHNGGVADGAPVAIPPGPGFQACGWIKKLKK